MAQDGAGSSMFSKLSESDKQMLVNPEFPGAKAVIFFTETMSELTQSERKDIYNGLMFLDVGGNQILSKSPFLVQHNVVMVSGY